MPRPPALLTAATSSGVVSPAMPARAIGCLMPRSSVKAVLITGYVLLRRGPQLHTVAGRDAARAWTSACTWGTLVIQQVAGGDGPQAVAGGSLVLTVAPRPASHQQGSDSKQREQDADLQQVA